MAKREITILDFGTSKIVAIQAVEVTGKKVTAVTAVGEAEYDGFMNEHWNEPEQVPQAIAAKIQESMAAEDEDEE